MSLLRLYMRVLDLLGREARLGWILAGANLLLAGAQFAEPVLFGRIVDVLSGKPSGGPLGSSSAWPLLAAWAGFGLFTILCNAVVALHDGRLVFTGTEQELLRALDCTEMQGFLFSPAIPAADIRRLLHSDRARAVA